MAFFGFGVCHGEIVPCERAEGKTFLTGGVMLYAAAVRGNLAKAFELANTHVFRRASLSKSYTDRLGRKLFLFLLTVQGLGAFALITLGVMLENSAWRETSSIRASGRKSRARAWRCCRCFVFVALALGFLVVGQTVSALAKVGAIDYLGSTMVIVVVRELGPLLAAMLVLARVGTANVIELGTARALGEVEALEALGIDPVHYLDRAARDRHGAGDFFADGLSDPRRAGERLSVCVFAGCAADAGRLFQANRRGA